MIYYNLLEKALITDNILEKERIVLDSLNSTSKEINLHFTPKLFKEPSYAKKCKIVAPLDVPKRKELYTKEGLAILIHAISHIEYSAIDLVIDAVYRFGFDMPKEYHQDWLEVALDEIKHFKLLESVLNKLEYKYGDFPVHLGLFEASIQTSSLIVERMAIIPRYYEAAGLDSNPNILKKLDNQRKDPIVKELIDALKIIYNEEITHVHKGDKWFKYLVPNESDKRYFEILEKFNLTKKMRPNINIKARKKAGFSCEEIIKLGAKECE